MEVKFTKWTFKYPNDHKLCPNLPFHGLQELTKVGIFGLEMFHLATLYPLRADCCDKSVGFWK
jgi:hypothetical protein